MPATLWPLQKKYSPSVSIKRLLDFSAALLGLIFLSPVLLLVMLAIWLHDWDSAFYCRRIWPTSNRTWRTL